MFWSRDTTRDYLDQRFYVKAKARMEDIRSPKFCENRVYYNEDIAVFVPKPVFLLDPGLKLLENAASYENAPRTTEIIPAIIADDVALKIGSCNIPLPQQS